MLSLPPADLAFRPAFSTFVDGRRNGEDSLDGNVLEHVRQAVRTEKEMSPQQPPRMKSTANASLVPTARRMTFRSLVFRASSA